MSTGNDVGLLLIAHGERCAGAGNAAALRLVSDLRARGIAAQVEIGFLRSVPTIAQALRRLRGGELLVFPLFMSDGHFARAARGQLYRALQDSYARYLTMLPPLGLDPVLADAIAVRAATTVGAAGYRAGDAEIVLVAHGSSSDPASQAAAEAVAQRIRRRDLFSATGTAFLDQPPHLREVLSCRTRPTVLVGLFAAEGRHGRVDLRRSIAAAARPDILFAGNVGAWPEIGDIIARRCAGWADTSGTKGLENPPRRIIAGNTCRAGLDAPDL